LNETDYYLSQILMEGWENTTQKDAPQKKNLRAHLS